MKKAQLRNILNKTILASSILYADSTIAAPCVYSSESKTVGGNITCSATTSSDTPFAAFTSDIKFNGTVTIPANPIQIQGDGALILGGNINFTKAVTITDVLSTASSPKSIYIQQGNTTMAGGITISNANAPFTAGMEIRGDNVIPTSFDIASITASNNNAYGLSINNKITSGIISGTVNISKTNRNYSGGVATNVDQPYGIKVDLAATPVFNGAVVISDVQITSGANLGLGTGIDIKSNAYAKFNSTVTITVPAFVSTSNTTGIQVNNAKADFAAAVRTENHGVHIGADNSTLVFNGPVSILEAWSLGTNKTGIKARNAANISLNSTLNILGGVTYGIDISGANTLGNFAKDLTILDNYNGINISSGGKGVFSGAVTVNKANLIVTNAQGISITSSGSAQFDGGVTIRNMDNKALNIQNSSPIFNSTINLADNKNGIYIDGTSNPVFNKSINSNNQIVSGVFNTDTSIKISGANAKASFVGGLTINNSLTGISLENGANPTMGSVIITQDLGTIGNTKLLPTDGILFTSGATGKFDGFVSIGNMTNRALNIQSSSPVFNNTITLRENKNDIYIDGTSDPVFNKSITSGNQILSGVFNNNNSIKISGANTKASFLDAISITNSLTGISLENGANPLFTTVNITQDLSASGNTKLLPTDGILFTTSSVGKFNGNITINNMTNRALNIQSSSPVFNGIVTLADNKTGIYIDGTGTPVFKDISSNNKIVSGVFNTDTSIKISGPNAAAGFTGPVNINNSLIGISLENGANPIFASTITSKNLINITQDLSASGNTKLLPTDGILFNTSSTGKFDGPISISNMTNRALNIQNSSPIFNNTITLADNKTGIYVDGTSMPEFYKAVTTNNKIVSGVFNSNNDIKVTGANAMIGFYEQVSINNSLTGISIDNGAKAGFLGNISINQDLSASGNTKLLPTDGILLTKSAYGTFDSISISNMTNSALRIQDSGADFGGTITLADNKNDIHIDGTSNPVFNKSITSNNQIVSGVFNTDTSIKISGANAKGGFKEYIDIKNSLIGVILENGADPVFAGDIIINQDLSASGNTKLLPTDGILLTSGATGKFGGAVGISNMTNRALNIQSSSPVFDDTISLFDNKTGIYVDGTSTPVFNKSVSSGNQIVSGVFNTDTSIKISGANAKASFSDAISINNSLTGISLDTKANPTFSGSINITQDLSASGNTKLLPTDGILFTTSSTGKFDGTVTINNMTNHALNIQGSSPIFNNSLTLLDNKNGIFIDGASAPVFNKAVNISKSDTINIAVEKGLDITNSSNPLFVGGVTVTNNKYGIGISGGSNASFSGVVNVSNNRGPNLGDIADPIGIYGIKIIDNSSADFKGNIVVADNYYKHIVDVNPFVGYSQVAKGIYIDDNSSANFSGSITTSMLNYPQQLSEGLRVSNNSSADFSGAISTSSHYQGIIVNDSSTAIFNNNVQMLEERTTVPLNNSAGLIVDNTSQVTFNSDVTANGFWRAGIEVKNGSIANFKEVVTAKNNESPVANTSTTMTFGSAAINISNSTVTFDKQPILDNNYNAIKISGATSDVTFSTDLLFTNNKSYGMDLSDVSAIKFKNITYNADPASYFSTFLNSNTSKATFDGAVNCNSRLCLQINDSSNIVFNDTFTAQNTLSNLSLFDAIAISSQQGSQLVFNKAVNIDGFYTGITSLADDYISFIDTVNITNAQYFGINLIQTKLAEFKKSVSIEGEPNVISSYGMYISGAANTSDPHQVIFSANVDVKNQFTAIRLQDSNVEFQKVVNIESEINQSSGYGIYIPGQTNGSNFNQVIFSGDVTIKNQSIAGLYLEKNNTVFNGNVTIEDSYDSLFSNATVSPTTNPTPVFNKNVTINNGTNGITVTGGELIFNGLVEINKSSLKGMNIASGGNNGENSKLYFNDTVEINDCVVGISTDNQFADNYLTFEKGLTINNPNIAANNEVSMSYNDYITFNGDSPVNAKIEGGIVTFTGAPTISRTIEAAQIVDFTLSDSSQRISLNADIGGTEIYTNAVKMGIDNNSTFTGNLHADNTIFDLSSKILTIDGSFTHGSNPVAKFASFALTPLGGITIDTYFDGTNAGHFEFATPSTVIDLSNSSQMIINITEAPGLPVLQPGETRQFDLFIGNGVSNFQLIDANNITITTNNPLSKWTIDTQEGILYQSLKTGGVGNMFKMVDSDGVTDPLMNSDEFVQELVDIIMNKGPVAGADALNKIGSPGAVIAASAPLSNIETGIIDTRLSSVIGAGDEEPIYGAWFAPLYGKATQKMKEEQPGFKSTYFGGIIGFDSKIDEYLSIGVAAGMSDGKLNHTDSNKGDRTDHKAYVGIIYLSYDLTERWMLQNTFSYGFSKVHNKEIRISTPVNKIARAKYDERRISNNIGFGYKTLLSNETLLIPFFALDFNRVSSISYTETGADIQNLKFSRSSLMEVDGIIGARLSRNFQYEDFVITPAVVANMRYAISGKEFTTDVRLASDDTIQIVPKTVSPDRKLYRLGASVNINNKDKDFLINYEFRKAEKFTSHQGSLKIQISF